MIAASGASVEGLKKFRSDVSDAFTSSSRMIWPVTVVPTFAPRITPMDWCSDMMPAPTRPDVSTMVAVELWMTAVTPRPSKNPTSGLFVTFSIALLNASEEPLFSPSPIRRIPYRNSARPPKREMMLKIVIIFEPLILRSLRIAARCRWAPDAQLSPNSILSVAWKIAILFLNFYEKAHQ